MNSKERFKAALLRLRELSSADLLSFNSELDSALNEYYNAYIEFHKELEK